MTIQAIAEAVAAVKALSELATQLAVVTPDAATENCAIAEDNSAFMEAAGSAEAAIQLAMDEVRGQTLTALDFALDELRLARADYLLKVSRNRVNAAMHAEAALRYMESGPIADEAQVETLDEDTASDGITTASRTLRLATVDGETIH